MSLRDRLKALEGKSEIPDASKPRPKHPGWEPGVIWHGESGEITTDPLYGQPTEWDDILRQRGLDPEVFEVVGDTMRWCS